MSITLSNSLLNADFASATVLISFGAVLGVTTPLQLIVMALIEIAIFSGNEWYGLEVIQVGDWVELGCNWPTVSDWHFLVGNFQRLLTWERPCSCTSSELTSVLWSVWSSREISLQRRKELLTTRTSSPWSVNIGHRLSKFNLNLNNLNPPPWILGTIFLWLFWPSFNSGLAEGDAQHRAVINTYYSLAACCIVSFAMSSLVSKENKFDMVHIQNSTLAGGVAIGTAADMMIHPFGAMIVGSIAGVVSVLGYRFLTVIFVGLFIQVTVNDDELNSHSLSCIGNLESTTRAEFTICTDCPELLPLSSEPSPLLLPLKRNTITGEHKLTFDQNRAVLINLINLRDWVKF